MGVNYPLTLIIIGFDTHPFEVLCVDDRKKIRDVLGSDAVSQGVFSVKL